MSVYFSNSLEILLAELKHNFREGQDLIVAPNHMVEAYVRISTGFDVMREVNVEGMELLHLFGFTSLEDDHFCRLEKRKNVVIYHVSPCSQFWSDIKSDREIGQFLRKRKLKDALALNLEELLNDRNALLANFGKKQRRFAFLVENSDFEIVEKYEIPEENTSLATLQREILLLQKNETTLADDGSIKIVSAESKYVEMLELERYLKSAQDVLVLAPDINGYAPYVRAFFEDRYQLRGISRLESSSFWQGISALLDLEQTRWERDSVIVALSHPLIREKWGFSDVEMRKIQQWCETLNIYWGYDDKHVEKLLKCTVDGFYNTWKSGFERLTESDELAKKWMLCLDTLYQKLQVFHSGVPLSPEDRQLSLLELSQTFFSSYELALSEEECCEGSGDICFASLKAMHPLPAQTICLIGMNRETNVEKQAFLQALLSAKKHLYISYVSEPSLCLDCLPIK